MEEMLARILSEHTILLLTTIVSVLTGLAGIFAAFALAHKYRKEGAKAGADAGATSARTVLDEQIQRVDALRADVAYAEDRNADLERRLHEALSRLDGNEEVLRATKLELKAAQDNLTLSLARIVQLEALQIKMQGELYDLQKTSSEKIGALESTNNGLQRDLLALQKSYQEAREQWAEERKDLLQRIEKLNTEILELKHSRNGVK